jgi:hypothetical protein
MNNLDPFSSVLPVGGREIVTSCVFGLEEMADVEEDEGTYRVTASEDRFSV